MTVVEDEEEAEQLRTQALQAIQTSIIPGFEALLEFIESEYLPATRPGIYLCSLADPDINGGFLRDSILNISWS